METVNNLASSASKAIWGTSNAEINQNGNDTTGREPIAGETGDVKAGEPYDKGNLDSTNTERTTASTTSDTIDKGPIRSEHDTDKTGVTSHHNPVSATASDKPTSSTATPADPSSATQNTQKQQGADRPHAEPGSEEHDRIKETKQEAEEAAKVDTSGPGPKSLEERARESGGDISGGNKESSGEDGPQKESHGEGTGEKYVKSSGVKADGGDFDAGNPGAGKEADRLLEQKGIHHTVGKPEPTPSEDKTGSPSGSGKEGKEGKVSLKDKIKAKLHKH